MRTVRHDTLSNFAPVHSSRFEHGAKHLEKSFVFSKANSSVRRRWFANLMWKAFPGASIRENALRAAPALDLTPRQCENLMKMEHDAKLGTVLAVLAIAGAENIFDIIHGGDRG